MISLNCPRQRTEFSRLAAKASVDITNVDLSQTLKGTHDNDGRDTIELRLHSDPGPKIFRQPLEVESISRLEPQAQKTVSKTRVGKKIS